MIRFFLSLFLMIHIACCVRSQSLNDSIQKQSYVFDSFITGTVLAKSGKVDRAPLNYCSYDQTILFKNGEETMTLIGLESIDSIFIGSKKFVPFEKKVFEVVDGKGRVELYADYVSKMVPWTYTVDKNGSAMKQNKEASNTVSSVYVTRPYKGEFSIQVIKKYWLKSFNKIARANNIKDFMKIFKEVTNPSIDEYVKTNHIDFSREEDLIKLVDFANTK